jgi:hypothetical protein
MPALSYKKAQEILSEKELERIASVFFICAENIKVRHSPQTKQSPY